MGLLGYEDPDVTQGLLAFGQMASQRRPFLGLLAGLAAADRSQGGRQEQMRQRDVEERKLRMEEALRQAQMGEIDAQRQQRLSAIEAAQRQAARAGEFNQALLGAGTVSPSQALAGGGGPTVANAERVGQSQPIDWQSLALRFPDQIDAITKLATARNLGRDKVARTIEVRGPDGRPQTLQVDEFGVPVGQGFSKPYEMRMQDIGGSVAPVDPFAPAALTKTQSPDSKASNALGWANFGLARDRLNLDRAKTDEGKWQFDSQRGVQINPVTGQWRPVTAADGKPLEAKGTSAEQAATAAVNAYKTIDSMLKHPGLDTAIGLSGQLDPRNYVWGTQAQGARALIEQAQGQAFLQAFESLRGGGQITQIEGEKATAAIARLQRAQNESDFKAAAKELQDIAAAAYQRAAGRPMPAQANTGLPSADAIAAELERRRRAGTSGGW